MKKLIAVLTFIFLLIIGLSLTTFAYKEYVKPNPITNVPYATPIVDGYIDYAEGYSNAVDFSEATVGHFWAHNPNSSKADLYYAYDDEGLYVGAVITEGLPAIDMAGVDVTGLNQFNYSTALDDLDIQDDGENWYGWNGDVMVIMVDPFGGFIAEGFSGGADKTAWYMVGLFEGDIARVYKSQTSTDGEITDQVKAEGKKTADGWTFEVMLPWDMIIADTDDCSMGYVQINKEDLVKVGTYLRVGAMYHDRYYDEEKGGLNTWGCYIAVPETLPDGTPGPLGVGYNIASYGIELYLDWYIPIPDPNRICILDVSEKSWYYDAVHYCVNKRYMSATLVQTCCVHNFYPDKNLTRAEVAMIFAKVYNADLENYKGRYYADVSSDNYYASAIAWAKQKGCMRGIGYGYFAPERYITREELAVILDRLTDNEFVAEKDILREYTDCDKISDWARAACAQGILRGVFRSVNKKELVFAPDMLVTRAQMAQIIYNMHNKEYGNKVGIVPVPPKDI